MILLIVFAFFAGIVTILSPCILPILPIVLSGSVTGSKKRPFGVVAGFIISFTFFTLFLSTIVRATGIPAESLRLISVFLIFMFGLSLVLSGFRVFIEKLFSQLASIASEKQRSAVEKTHSDFFAGILIGISLGLIWTPCVGPILASVISLAITGTVNGSAVVITLAYATGTAIPLLAITYGGRQLLDRAPWLTRNTKNIQKVFGVLMIATAIAIQFNLDRKFQTYILSAFPQYGVGLTKFEDNDLVRKALSALRNRPIDERGLGKPMFETVPTNNQGKAPEFISGGQWFNSPALTMQELRGKVVLVDFWTYTCINCIRTLPYIEAWHKKYSDKGLVIVGIHTPEFEFERSSKNVAGAIKDFGLTYPIMQDNNYATWSQYNNRYWPAKYLIDKDGNIRYTHVGEGEYDETETMIQKLLEETGTTITEVPNNPSYTNYDNTPELYLGYKKIRYLISPERTILNKETTFTSPEKLLPRYFAYTGKWTLSEQYAMPKTGSTLLLHFDAADVFLVMRPKASTPGKIRVILDNEPVGVASGEDVVDGITTVNKDRLYKLIKLPTPGLHLLKLEFLDENTEVFAFTFG